MYGWIIFFSEEHITYVHVYYVCIMCMQQNSLVTWSSAKNHNLGAYIQNVISVRIMSTLIVPSGLTYISNVIIRNDRMPLTPIPPLNRAHAFRTVLWRILLSDLSDDLFIDINSDTSFISAVNLRSSNRFPYITQFY